VYSNAASNPPSELRCWNFVHGEFPEAEIPLIPHLTCGRQHINPAAMSFGFAIGDFIILLQLASRVARDSRKACGAHDELTHEVSSLHIVLQRLKKETQKPESPLNRPGDSCQDELQSILAGCGKLLKTLETILTKYNALGQAERSGRKLWQRVRFGNGEMQDLTDLRAKLVYYTSALSLFLNMVSIGSIGRVEKRMEEAGGDLREIKLAVNGITAHLLAGSKAEGSVLTAYADDDKAVWKEFRRELVLEGFSSATIHKHKDLIKAYVKELASRGLLDERDTYVEDNEATYDSSDAGADPLPTPSEGTVQADGASGERPTSRPNRYSYHKSSSDSEARLYEPDYPSKTEIGLRLSINYTPEVEGDHFWTMGDTPILRLPRDDSCKVLGAGQTIEDVPRPILTSPVRNESIRCVRCLSDILTVRIVVLPCGHRMCLGCLRGFFILSIIEPQYMPPRCYAEDLEDIIPFEYVDNVFNERFKLQWEKEYSKFLERLKRPYDVDKQLALDMIKDADVSMYWGGNSAQPFICVFVVSPYGIYLTACGYNVSVLLCRFRHWLGIIQNCLSEPRVARCQQESLVPPHVLHDIAVLRWRESDGVHIASTVEAGTFHAVDPVLIHWKFINILTQHTLSEERWREIRNILHNVDHWTRDSNGLCLDLIFSVQQWIYLVESTEAKMELEAVTSEYEWNIGEDYLSDKLYESLALNPDLNRDQVDSSAPTESRKSDDRKDLVLDSIAMAQAIWIGFDKLGMYYSARSVLSQRLSYYQDEIEPRCVNYLVGPPSDARTKVLAFKILHECVETDFLDKVNCPEMHEDQSLTYTTERLVQEAKCLLERLKEGISSANDPIGGTSQENTGSRFDYAKRSFTP